MFASLATTSLLAKQPQDTLAEDEATELISQEEFNGSLQHVVGRCVEAIDDEVDEALETLKARAGATDAPSLVWLLHTSDAADEPLFVGLSVRCLNNNTK